MEEPQWILARVQLHSHYSVATSMPCVHHEANQHFQQLHMHIAHTQALSSMSSCLCMHVRKDCEGSWLSSGYSYMVEHWWFKPLVPLLISSHCHCHISTFLYFALTKSEIYLCMSYSWNYVKSSQVFLEKSNVAYKKSFPSCT